MKCSSNERHRLNSLMKNIENIHEYVCVCVCVCVCVSVCVCVCVFNMWVI